jgi:thiamine kinase-like enzyme
LFKDYENYLFIMSSAPQGAVTWKTDLLKGKVNWEIARKAGRYLATIQNESRKNSGIKKHFNRNDIYVEGRINPYYRVLPAIHPEIKDRIASLVRTSLNRRMTLSLTDYSPKNMMVKGNQLMLIDQEGAHWGDPCFDSAFCLNHLFLKAVHNRDWRRRYFRAIQNYWGAYSRTLDWGDVEEIEKGVLRHLGAL